MLSSFKDGNIIKLSHKTTSSEEIDKIHQVLIDVINGKMYALVQKDKYGATNTTYTTKMGYYVIKFVSEP